MTLSPEQIAEYFEHASAVPDFARKHGDISKKPEMTLGKICKQAKAYSTLVEFINASEFPFYPPDKGHFYNKESRFAGFYDLKQKILNFRSNQEKQDE